MINYVSKFSNNNTEYVIKDSTARSDISSLQTNKANDDEVVKLAGTQTITGGKTLTQSLVVNNSTTSVVYKQANVDKGTTPSSRIYGNVTLYDKNGNSDTNRLAQLLLEYTNNGSTMAGVGVSSPISGSTSAKSIYIEGKPDGTFVTYAPTPASSDNSTQIATTAFVKAQNYINDASLSTVYVVKSYYRNNNNFYKVYSNGWIEQGGWKSGFTAANTFEDITLHKPFSSTYYGIQITGGGSATTIYNYKVGNSSTNSTTSFKLLASNTGAACYWFAYGMGDI